MKCSEIRIHLGALVDGEIRDPALLGKLERHLGACSECRRELEAQRAVKGLLARLEPERTSAVMPTRVMQAIKDGGRKRQPLVLRPAYVAAVVAVLRLTAYRAASSVSFQSSQILEHWGLLCFGPGAAAALL